MVEGREQVVGKVGDAEEPLGQFALLDIGARTPALAVDHLLVGEHGHVDRIPVDLGLLAIGQALGQEVEEQHLLAMVVFDVAGREFTRPVQRQAHRLQLAAHGRDVLVGPFARMHLVLHRGVLGRHAEGVPAHRMQHVEPLGPAVARDHVAHGIIAHMAHMDAARGIGKHLEDVVFLARRVGLGLEQLRLVPGGLPARFGCAGIVAFCGHAADRDAGPAGSRPAGEWGMRLDLLCCHACVQHDGTEIPPIAAIVMQVRR